jgi:endonuclease-8
MAEGDSILRLARRLERALGGERVSADDPGRRRPDGLPVSMLQGRTLERVESRGKHLLLHFDGGLALHSHLGMRGSWHLYRPGEAWRRPVADAWLALAADAAVAVNFGGSSLRLARASELRRDPRLARLGPDILAADFDPAAALSRLRRAGPQALGEALLDQTLLAGIGNIFKSEGCFQAGLDPFAPIAGLTDGELAAVLAGTRALMQEAVASGRQPSRVYRRAGRPCPRCRTPLRSAAQGDSARTTYWCPRCQPQRRAGRPALAKAG